MEPVQQFPDHRARQPVVGVVSCAAGGLDQLRQHLVVPLLNRGYRVAVSLTPTAGWWLSESGEVDTLETLTGLPVCWTSRLPTEPKPHPPVDCYAVVPATATSVAKLALGLGDNQALTPVCEAIGDPTPVSSSFPRSPPRTQRTPPGAATSMPYGRRCRARPRRGCPAAASRRAGAATSLSLAGHHRRHRAPRAENLDHTKLIEVIEAHRRVLDAAETGQ